jgi:hypothetical protein
MTPRGPRRRGASGTPTTNEKLARAVADHAQFRLSAGFRDALQLIQPTPGRRSRCEDDVYRARLGVRVAESMPSYSPKNHKAYLFDIIGKLKAAEDIVTGSLKNQLKAHREAYQKFADTIIVRPGSPQPNNAKRIATHYAHWLLKGYGSLPRVTFEGPWHKLANVLYGDSKADLFDCLRRYRDFGPLYVGESDLSNIDKLEAAYRQVC